MSRLVPDETPAVRVDLAIIGPVKSETLTAICRLARAANWGTMVVHGDLDEIRMSVDADELARIAERANDHGVLA